MLQHPTRNRNVRAVITGLAKAGMLAEFQTTIAVESGAFWIKLLPGKLRKELLRRTFPLPSKQIFSYPYR